MTTTKNPLSIKSKLLIVVVIVVAVVIPVQFWYGVWFGRGLSDEEIDRYLASTSAPRQLQHALAQVQERIQAGDPAVSRWYGRVVDLASHPLSDIRAEAAWVMGQDNASQTFHQALIPLLEDASPLVRRNAALALVRFEDRAALPELRRMLQNSTISSPDSGRISLSVEKGDWISRGTEVARVNKTEKTQIIIEALLPGQVLDMLCKSGQTVASGEELIRVSPDPSHVWEALRALFLIGSKQELGLVESFRDDPRMSDEIRRQATATLEAIRQRD